MGVLFASLTVVAADATLLAEPAEAIPLHSLHVSLYPDSLDAKPTNTDFGAVSFGGNVTVEKVQGVARVTVTLDADTDRGWPVVWSPQTMVFINPGTQRFTVTVIVPLGTPPSVGTVTAVAQADSPIWSETETTEARVNVIQFYEYETWIDGTVGNGIPGGSISGELVIYNNGTGEDTYLIALEDVPDVVTSWDVPESVTIPSKMEMEVEFTFALDDDYDVPYEGQMFTLVFEIRSAGAPDSDPLREHTIHYYIYIEGLEAKLVNNWPTYVAYGVIVALAITASFIIFRRVKRSREDLSEADATEG